MKYMMWGFMGVANTSWRVFIFCVRIFLLPIHLGSYLMKVYHSLIMSGDSRFYAPPHPPFMDFPLNNDFFFCKFST